MANQEDTVDEAFQKEVKVFCFRLMPSCGFNPLDTDNIIFCKKSREVLGSDGDNFLT